VQDGQGPQPEKIDLENAELEINFFPGTRVEVVSFDIQET